MDDKILNAVKTVEFIAAREEEAARLSQDILLKNVHSDMAKDLRFLVCFLTGEGLWA